MIGQYLPEVLALFVRAVGTFGVAEQVSCGALLFTPELYSFSRKSAVVLVPHQSIRITMKPFSLGKHLNLDMFGENHGCHRMPLL